MVYDIRQYNCTLSGNIISFSMAINSPSVIYVWLQSIQNPNVQAVYMIDYTVTPYNNATRSLTVYPISNIYRNDFTQYTVVYDLNNFTGFYKTYDDQQIKPLNTINL